MTAGEENLGLTACLAEYEALRNEIAWLIDHALHIQNYAIGITAGLYPAAALVYRAAPLLVVPLLLTVPLPLSVLGFLYFRQSASRPARTMIRELRRWQLAESSEKLCR